LERLNVLLCASLLKLRIMKVTYILLGIVLTGCNAKQEPGKPDNKDIAVIHDTLSAEKKKPEMEDEKSVLEKPTDSLPVKTYSNERFKEVTIEKTGDHKFVVKGKAQIFEAQFSWVVEDGHEELKKGFTMTDAGAPEWGKFSFEVDVLKKRSNSTLHLILFESSAKDGSRQYELPLPLY
jgi:hypothetical protein